MNFRSHFASCVAGSLAFVLSVSVQSVAQEAVPPGAVAGTVVDEAGQPIVGAAVSAVSGLRTSTATSDKLGQFQVAVEPGAGGDIYAWLVARTEDGRLAFSHVRQEDDDAKPLNLVAKPGRRVEVLVQDSAGNPVEGAHVEFSADYRQLAGSATNAKGEWADLVPVDAKNWSLSARKGGVGFDYATAELARIAAVESDPLSSPVKLTLDGAQTIKVRTIDHNSRPVAGVRVGLWYVQKAGYAARISFPATSDEWARTNADGMVILDWLPASVERSWPIMYSAEHHSALEHAFFVPGDKPVDELTINLLPVEELSGRVTHADGRPAANILVRAQGQGAGGNRFQRATRTDAEGRYRFRAYSEQAYIVAVVDRTWAAACQGDVVIRSGQPVHGVDFMLGPVTRVHGRVTVGRGEPPEPLTTISAVIDKGGIPEELRRPDDRLYRGLQMSIWTSTDGLGRYELFLGPGEYQLRGPPRTDPVKLTIAADNPPAEIVQDFTMPRPETGPFKLRVVDQLGQPVAGAVVSGQYASMQARRMFGQMKAGADGVITVERSLDPLVLHAQSPDPRLAGMTRVEAEQAEAEIVVGPTAKASGRLTDREGRPIPNKEFSYGIAVYQGEPGRSPFTTSFGGDAVADAQGRFTLENLVPGQPYRINVRTGERSIYPVVTVRPEGPAEIDLGDQRADYDPPKPYVPPTPAERAATAIGARPEESPRQRLGRVLVESRREYTCPLVLFGADDDPACIDLFRLFEERDDAPSADKAAKQDLPSIASMRWEFELLSLDRKQPRFRQFAEQLGLQLAPDGPPVLAVLDDSGAMKAHYVLILNDGKLAKHPLAAFLNEHRLPTRDAEQMLADALERAAEDKRVFLILSASWCGPCRRLSAFLADHQDELRRHFVFVKLDISRDKHAQDVQARYKESRNAGVPWFTILDKEGNVIVTSNAPALDSSSINTNIGHPTEPKAIDHFISMLQRAAPRMNPDTLREMQQALSKQL